MRRHPNVRVEQIAIPDRIYASWMVTQLTGGSAPDLIQIGGPGTNDERIARYFQPISDHVALPNPYNAGTPLEGVPWKDTFLDGLAGNPNFNINLLEWYAVSMATLSQRLYYNRDLLVEITGADDPPRDFQGLLELSRQVEAHAQRTGRPLLPIAASLQSSQIILSRVLGSLTQRLAVEEDPNLQFAFGAESFSRRVLLGGASLRHPAFEGGLAAMGDIARHMMPGFNQLRREDANFAFLQQRALFIPGGSWDFRSFTDEATFRVGIIPFPVPTPDDPSYPGLALGPLSEAGTGTSIAFGIFRGSPNQERALDFLRFITSQEGNTRFSHTSSWPPSVVGVEIPGRIRPFQPATVGFPGGATLDFQGMPDLKRAFDNNVHLLYRPPPGTTPREAARTFLDALEPVVRPAIISDLRRNAAGLRRTAARNDTRIAEAVVHMLERPDPAARRRLAQLIAQQSDGEFGMLHSIDTLAAAGVGPTP
jgi:raffinose/stachyose/melibiose transport system substrate-binding protein